MIQSHNRMRSLVCRVSGFCLLFLATAHADRIILTNGRILEGLIIQETPDQLVISIGAGRMTVRRNQVERIEPATDVERGAIEDAWRSKYFLNDAYVPDGYQAWARALRSLEARRGDVARAVTQASQDQGRLTVLEQEAGRLQREAADRAGAVAAPVEGNPVAIHNERVMALNAVRARQLVNQQDQSLIRERMEAARTAVQGYPLALTDLIARFNQFVDSKDREPRTVETREFETRFRARLAALEKEVPRVVVPIRMSGNIARIEVKVNQQSGRFIVDTGAAMMTISDAFAARLGILPDDGMPTTVTMADGTSRPARVVRLDRVSAGEVSAGQIEAIVLPAPGPDVDGLLGMSFLGRFHVYLDTVKRELTLRYFKPGS